MVTEYIMILRDLDKNSTKALEIISNIRADPKSGLAELMQVLNQIKDKAQIPGLENLPPFLQNSLQLLEKLTHLETNEKELNKIIYIVSRIVYELSDRIDVLKKNDLDLQRELEDSTILDDKEEAKGEVVPVESNIPQIQRFVAFEYWEKKYLIEIKHVEKIIPWDKKLVHKLPLKDLGFSGGMVYGGALIPILGGNRSSNEKQGKSLAVCQMAKKQFVVVCNKEEAILQIPKKQVLSLEAEKLEVCDEMYTIFKPEILDNKSSLLKAEMLKMT
ncbi:MAG: hypothetical protein AB8G05_08250 [Oligoflexales bacterium]